jgi:transposase
MHLQTKVTQIYTESFKRSVIEEFLEGSLSKIELRRKYNIGGKSAILTWMRQLGYSNYNPLVKKPKFDVAPPLKIPMAWSEKSNLELQKEINDLKRKLEDERLRSEAYLRIIQKAEEELKTSFKKKPNTK